MGDGGALKNDLTNQPHLVKKDENGEGASKIDDRHSLWTASVMHLTDYPRQALLHTFIECVFISSARCMLGTAQWFPLNMI